MRKKTINCKGKLIDLSTPKIMGIVNLTPDSFYDGGKNNTSKAALKQVEKHLGEGADIIDIGAYSSRPGAKHISLNEEKNRLIPILKDISKEFPASIISIDTFRSEIALEAFQNGASVINDISGGELDENMFKTIGRLGVPYILMHMNGTPQNMSNNQIDKQDVFHTVKDFFAQKIYEFRESGGKDIILDPGFGFGKTVEANFSLLNNLSYLVELFNLPTLIGVSRKSSIYKTLNIKSEEALNGTTVLNTVSLLRGANILRVHDVKEAIEVKTLIQMSFLNKVQKRHTP